MKTRDLFIIALSLFPLITFSSDKNKSVEPNLEGLTLPEKYKDWRVISASHRTDNKSMRIILGNDIAIKASRSNQTNPWPDGTILGKLVWKQTTEKNWPTAIAPEEFIHAEFMYKDSKIFKANGTGWGWARWLGKEQRPYGDNNDLNQSCIACHTPVKGRDWVYTTPVQFP
ncbi:MAG TPA: cytochrome P460 [Colwellia sp.]|nr:cytochrome P460 [Colwellia sp.]|tara:strand:- start:349 stop:861 length:513 start_codon:yes stop_codon:yes gene_type:complete